MSWFDLLPPEVSPPALESLLTRDELLARLQALGVDVDAVTLVYWEKAGVLPRAVRRFRGGRGHALYPFYAIDAVQRLRQEQAAGRTLEEITPLMRQWARFPVVVAAQDQLSTTLTDARTALLALARALGRPIPARIRIAFVDGEDRETWHHELTIPAEWWRQE